MYATDQSSIQTTIRARNMGKSTFFVVSKYRASVVVYEDFILLVDA
jgi:hypothetical protein